MNVTTEELHRHYQDLSDNALLEIDSEELQRTAREIFLAEKERRGLNSARRSVATDAPAQAADEQGPAEQAEFSCITEYDFPEEAEIARSLLEAEGIAARVDHEPNVFRLMVAPDLAESALSMLVTPISDEDLAAQAAAAGVGETVEE